jgi:succinate dehydrogenase / fumarate reductase membrane anchor subunit
MATNEKPIQFSPGSYALSWKWMRYSAFLLIPLVWIHSIIQALITGGHNLSLEYVRMRWLIMGWRIYDIFLLAFALSHGILGLRQILFDYIRNEKARPIINWSLLISWFVISLIGAVAIIGGVKLPSK